MAKKVEQLTAQTAPPGSALIVISEGGVSKKSTIDQITADARADLQANIDLKAPLNTPITPKTATKITYDANGFVTGGTSATTADINDTTDRRYITDLQKTFLEDQLDLFDGNGNLVLPTPGAGIILTSPSGDEFTYTANDEGMLVDMSGFVKVQNGDFILHGRPYKGVGFNYYPLAWSSKATIVQILDYIAKVGGNEVRFWAHDQLNPSDSGGNFHFLDYPLTTPNMFIGVADPDLEAGSTGWTFHAEFTRVADGNARTGSYAIKQVSAGNYNGMQTDDFTVTAGAWYTLTFWYKRVSQSGFGPLLQILKGSDGSQLVDGGLLEQAGDPAVNNGYVRKQLQFNTGAETAVKVRIQNFSGTVTFYYDDFWLNPQGTPLLSQRESQFLIMDFAADEARKRGIKLVPSFADNTSSYNTKLTYVRWANSIHGVGLSTSFPYIGFFENTFAKQLYKNNLADFWNRKNTINGMIYKEDPTFKAAELGNELRTDRSDPSGVNTLSSANLALLSLPGGWADEMSTYLVETLGIKQLVTFGSMSHEWEYRDGDSVYNGTYYGVSAKLMAQLPHIHYLDFHLYPTQDALQPYLWPLGELDIVSYGQYVLGSAVRPPPIRSTTTSGTSKVVPFNEATIVGDIIVPHLSFSGTPGSTPVVTDDGGNTYTLTSNTSTVYHYTSTHTAPATQLSISWTTNRSITVYVDENSGRENKNNGRSRAGLEAQLLDWINIGKAVGKPAAITETGLSVDLNNRYNYHLPLQPRVDFFDWLFEYWFRNGGGQIDLWSATIVGGTSYSVNLGDRDGAAVTDNTDDTNANNLIRYWNKKLLHDQVKPMQDLDPHFAVSELSPRTFDGDYQGITQLGVSGESVTFGNLLYLDEFTSTWKKADANLLTTADRKLGMCALTAGSGESIKVLIMGTIRADSLFPTFVVGRPVFMSETAGLISTSKPTTSGAVHRIIGYADSADQITFQPDGYFSYVS